MHIIRNAIDHGIETPEEREKEGKPRTGTIRLTARRTPSNIIIEITDDGRGLDIEAIRKSARKIRRWRDEELDAMPPEEVRPLIFVSGLSTSSFVSDLSGRGVGLDVVRRNVERLKGEAAVESAPGEGCAIRIKLPITLATARVLIISAGSVRYALPVEYVVKSYPLPKREIFTIEGHNAVIFDKRAISVVRLADILKIRRSDLAAGSGATEQIENVRGEETVPCIIINAGDEQLGLLVDELLDEQEFVLKPESSILTHIRDISGATILGTGEVCMVLNPPEIAANLRRLGVEIGNDAPVAETERKKIILLAEDSLTTRTQMKRILDGAGYEVVAAVDGADAFARLATLPFDALVSDICMPNMDGLTLTRKVRQEKKYSELPVILVTMLASDEDKRKGLEAGANAYITKPAFDQKLLLDTLRRLV
jgi:two-component system chemotaxis sensor kinase CheA